MLPFMNCVSIADCPGTKKPLLPKQFEASLRSLTLSAPVLRNSEKVHWRNRYTILSFEENSDPMKVTSVRPFWDLVQDGVSNHTTRMF